MPKKISNDEEAAVQLVEGCIAELKGSGLGPYQSAYFLFSAAWSLLELLEIGTVMGDNEDQERTILETITIWSAQHVLEQGPDFEDFEDFFGRDGE